MLMGECVSEWRDGGSELGRLVDSWLICSFNGDQKDECAGR